MKARANHWLNFNGVWIEPGGAFEASEAELEELGGAAEAIAQPAPVPPEKPETEKPAEEKPAARKRRK